MDCHLPPATCHLPAEELAELRAAHRGTRDDGGRVPTARTKAVASLLPPMPDWRTDDGVPTTALAWRSTKNPVRNHFECLPGRGLRVWSLP